MVVFPNVKINLGLHVLRQRPDGFHDLDTCFYPVPLTDILEAVPSKEFEFSQTGIPVPGSPESNLCLKAYTLLKENHNIPPVKMHLHKIVPMGAGLGGGSSDGAFTLRLLNELFHLRLTQAEMSEYAALLGSDCPFFIYNKPMIGSGRGTDLQSTEISLRNIFIRIIHPGIHISTAQAFSKVKPEASRQSVSEILALDRNEWKSELTNDFCKGAYAGFNELSEIESSFYADGAFYACMSGSGSSVFGLFESEPPPAYNTDYFTWTGQLA